MGWDQLLLSACGGGIAAGAVVAVLTSLSGGPVGPGRMRHVGPNSAEVLVHAVAASGIGALAGALVLLAWRWQATRRR